MSCKLNTLLRKKSFGPGPRHHIEGPNATIRSLQGKVRWRRAGWDPPLPAKFDEAPARTIFLHENLFVKTPTDIVERSILASLPLYVLLQSWFLEIIKASGHLVLSKASQDLCEHRPNAILAPGPAPLLLGPKATHPFIRIFGCLWILACQYRLKRWLETSYLLNCPHHIHHGHGKTIVFQREIRLSGKHTNKRLNNSVLLKS